jgi:hypothetical protein
VNALALDDQVKVTGAGPDQTMAWIDAMLLVAEAKAELGEPEQYGSVGDPAGMALVWPDGTRVVLARTQLAC